MSYIEQWKALSSRIHGLVQAGELHAHYLAVRSSDTYGRAKRLRDQSASILAALTAFADRFQHVLPSEASDIVRRFLGEMTPLICGEANRSCAASKLLI